MTRNLTKIRNKKMKAQDGLCFYCEQPMWAGNPEQFRKRYNLTPKQALRFQCTAEHLHAKSDGGPDNNRNIVAAHRYCNQTRHLSSNPLSPDLYAEKTRRRLASGKWHGFTEDSSRRRN